MGQDVVQRNQKVRVHRRRHSQQGSPGGFTTVRPSRRAVLVRAVWNDTTDASLYRPGSIYSRRRYGRLLGDVPEGCAKNDRLPLRELMVNGFEHLRIRRREVTGLDQIGPVANGRLRRRPGRGNLRHR